MKTDHEIKFRSNPIRSWVELGRSSCIPVDFDLIAITMMPFATLYLNLIRNYSGKTLMTQKDPFDVICDVTQSTKCTNA